MFHRPGEGYRRQTQDQFRVTGSPEEVLEGNRKAALVGHLVFHLPSLLRSSALGILHFLGFRRRMLQEIDPNVCRLTKWGSGVG